MASVIEMPRLSDTMEEGVVASWHKQIGEQVSSGDLLAEIETDKATMDFESPEDGVLLHIGVEEGKGIPVGSLLAIIGEKDEDVSRLIKGFESKGNGEVKEEDSSPEPQPAAGDSSSSADSGQAPSKEPETSAFPVSTAAASPQDAAGRIKASPLAKAMAKERGIDLKDVKGSGDNGRIIKRDIESYQPAQTKQAPATAPTPQTESYEEVRVSQMRKTIAKRLSESKFTAPHFYLTMEIDMGRSVDARKQLNEISPVKISFNDLVIKAAAVALKQHPKVNASWLGDTIRYHHEIHIGMAVAVEEGLLVPVIRNADAKGLSKIAEQSKDFATRARNRELEPSEWAGNTFTVSNLGMFGIEEFTAIINPPDACILAIGGIKKIPVVKDDEIVVGHRMKVTLSCDHRVVDGATGAAFLVTLKELLEDPMRMLI